MERGFIKSYKPWIFGGIVTIAVTMGFFWNNAVPRSAFSTTIILLAICILLPLWIYQERRASTPPLLLIGFIEVAWILVIGFAIEYWVLSHEHPNSFRAVCENLQSSCTLSHVDSIYLTLTVFTTTGFGDITPVGQAARALVSAQMCVSIVFFVAGLALVLNRLDRKKGNAGQG